MNSALVSLLVLSLCIGFSQCYTCSTPCITNNPCHEAFCDEALGVCTEKLKFPLPEGCCTKLSDCNSNSACLLPTCNFDTNECVLISTCSSVGISDPEQSCSQDFECRPPSSCATAKCINSVCVTSHVIDVNSNPFCCTSAADCDSYPCTQKFCNTDTFECFYIQNQGCTIQDATDSLPIALRSTGDGDSPSPGGADSQVSPGVGDIIGAVIGFIIFAILILAFIIVVIMMIIQKFVRQIRGE